MNRQILTERHGLSDLLNIAFKREFDIALDENGTVADRATLTKLGFGTEQPSVRSEFTKADVVNQNFNSSANFTAPFLIDLLEPAASIFLNSAIAYYQPPPLFLIVLIECSAYLTASRELKSPAKPQVVRIFADVFRLRDVSLSSTRDLTGPFRIKNITGTSLILSRLNKFSKRLSRTFSNNQNLCTVRKVVAILSRYEVYPTMTCLRCN